MLHLTLVSVFFSCMLQSLGYIFCFTAWLLPARQVAPGTFSVQCNNAPAKPFPLAAWLGPCQHMANGGPLVAWTVQHATPAL
jgi:hypothetical protein